MSAIAAWLSIALNVLVLLLLFRRRSEQRETEARLQVLEALADMVEEEKPSAPAEAVHDYSIVEDARRARAARERAR